LARVLLALGRYEEGRGLLRRLLEAAETGQRTGQAIETLVLLAVADYRRGSTAQALAHLRRALLLGEPRGYKRVFLDEGEEMRQLLREGQRRGLASQLAASLGEAGAVAPVRQAATRAALTLPEPLTDREIEVLKLLAEGRSNQEIASRLIVSVGTVKTHTHNIYAKLGTAGRTAAIARARELHLV
ncbi:MAG: helix-turn-helix domain-containing protein, partial [Chloroflexota bacterium]